MDLDIVRGLNRLRAFINNMEKDIKNQRKEMVHDYNRGYTAMKRLIDKADSFSKTVKDDSWLNDLKGNEKK